MGSFFRIFVYSLVALVAVFAYFHIQCQNEKEEKSQKKTTKFDLPFKPEETDCLAQLVFAEKGSDVFIHTPIIWTFQQWLPCAVMKMMQAMSGIRLVFLRQSSLEMKNGHNICPN